MKVEFMRATIDDVDKMIEVQNKSFYEDFIKYGECPGYNRSKEVMTNSVLNRIVFKIVVDDEIIGNIIVRDNNDTTYYLGCLCVIPEYENKGIGQEAINFIESQFPDARSWALETPSDKLRNHYFYKKMGYSVAKEYMDGSVKVVLFKKEI